jgi:phosphate starvation-inducible protein PhoH
MAKITRFVKLEHLNVQTYVDARHLAQAARLFLQNQHYGALKNMSALVRSIIEDWIALRSGQCEVKSLDEAIEILNTVQLAPERTPRSKYRRVDKENYIAEAREHGAYSEENMVVTPTELTKLKNNTIAKLTPQQRQMAQAALELLHSGTPLNKED